MAKINDELFNWCIENLSIVSENCSHEMPEKSSLYHLTKGKNANIWKYVVDHVRSRIVVNRIKLTLLKKRMIDKLEEAPPSSVNVWMEVETRKIKRSKARKKYLEQTLVDFQSRIEICEHDLTRIRQDIVKVKNMHSILSIFELQCRKKVQQNNTVRESILSVLMSLKRFRENMELSYNIFSCDESLNMNFANIDDILHRVKSILKSLFDNDTISSKNCVKDQYYQIRTDFKDILDQNQLIDVLFPLEKMAQKDFVSFKDINNQLSFQGDDPIKTSQSVKLIQALKFIHIQESFEKITISKQIKAFSQDELKSLVNPNIISGLGCTTSYSLQIELFRKLSEEKALTKGIHCLEAILSQHENDTSKVLIQTGCCRKECQDIKTVMQDAYKKMDLIHWLLNENVKGFYSVSCKHQKFSNLLKNVFINVPIITDQTANMENIFNSDKELLWAFSQKTNLFKPIVKEMNLHEIVPNERFLQALGMHTRASVDAFVQKYLLLNHSIKNQQSFRSELSFNEHKANPFIGEIMVQTPFFSNLSNLVKQITQGNEKAKKICHNSELTCSKVESSLREWWNQDAQFLHPITAEGNSLKIWLNILNVLSES